MIKYQDIIKDRDLRVKIIQCFGFIPDEYMIRLQYFIKAKRLLNLRHPKRYTEKIQWYKLYYRNPVMTICVDKHLVKDHIRKVLGEEYVIPELFCWRTAEEIDFSIVPNNCVIKTNNGTGTNIFIKDKESVDFEKVRKQLSKWLNRPTKSAGREWAYDNVKPVLICEPVIPAVNQAGEGLDDYKFFCFNGKVVLKWIDYDRFVDHKRILYTAKGKRISVECSYKSPKNFPYPKEAFEVLQPIAEKLAEGFPHVRVDLYYTGGKVYFGELTFYSGSGYEFFSSDKYDFKLGSYFNLPRKLVQE